MCTPTAKKKGKYNFQILVLLGLVLGVFSSYFPIPGQEIVASGITKLFMNALKLVSLPIIFLSLLCTICGMKEVQELKWLGKRVLTYTLLTTVLAAIVALGLFLWIDPVNSQLNGVVQIAAASQGSYFTYLSQIIPSNLFQPFIEGNVISVLFLAIILGAALLFVPRRDALHSILSPLLTAFMKITVVICYFIPLTVWAGMALSFKDLQDGSIMGQLFLYLACVIGANLLQGAAVLPIILKSKGISPVQALKGLFPALTVAFFSKSSVATLPVAMRCAEDNLKVSSKISQFSFPVCTTINMNGCAAFILTTVLFVSMSNGFQYNMWELVGWVFVATLAAVGNAGVPMGCYFLSSALLASMDVPLGLMALILPFYSLIDMLETAINVWSDGCVTLIVEKQYQQSLQPEANRALDYAVSNEVS